MLITWMCFQNALNQQKNILLKNRNKRKISVTYAFEEDRAEIGFAGSLRIHLINATLNISKVDGMSLLMRKWLL